MTGEIPTKLPFTKTRPCGGLEVDSDRRDPDEVAVYKDAALFASANRITGAVSIVNFFARVIM